MAEPIAWTLYLIGFMAVFSSGFVEEKRDAWLLTIVAICWPMGASLLAAWEIGRSIEAERTASAPTPEGGHNG